MCVCECGRCALRSLLSPLFLPVIDLVTALPLCGVVCSPQWRLAAMAPASNPPAPAPRGERRAPRPSAASEAACQSTWCPRQPRQQRQQRYPVCSPSPRRTAIQRGSEREMVSRSGNGATLEKKEGTVSGSSARCAAC